MVNNSERIKKEDQIEDLTLGDIIESEINNNEQFENLLDKKGISNEKERKIYSTNYQRAMISYSQIVRNMTENYFSSINTIIMKFNKSFRPILRISNYFSDLVKPLNKIFSDFSKVIIKLFPLKWTEKLLLELKVVKKFYIKKLIKSFTTFKFLFILYKTDRDKQLIIFSQFILYISTIFENYTKKIIKIFKNQPDEFKERIYRDDIKSIIKEFYDPIEINYARLFGYLYNIADNIKHEDSKFYKRFSKYSYEDLVNESTELYLDLKLYLKNTLVAFFITQVRLYHLNQYKIT